MYTGLTAEMLTAEPLVLEPSYFENGIAIKLQRYTSPGTVQSPAELIQAGGNT
jgi:hypothetical protein